MKTNHIIQNILLTFLISTASATAQNIVTNGSFEQVQLSSPFYSLNPADIPGWTHAGDGDQLLVHLGFGDFAGTVIAAGDGLQFVTLGGGYNQIAYASWSQVLNGLTPGVIYQLSFKMASEDGAAGAGLLNPMSLTVEFPSGSSTAPQIFSSTSTQTNYYWPYWESKTMNFTATSNQVELVFSATTQYDIGLDAVSVTVAPVQIEWIPPFTNGQFLLSVSGQPGTNYIIQVATNLASSNIVWTPLFTSNSVTGKFQFLDSQATNPMRFYRAVSQ